MSLGKLEILELRAADGLCSDEELAELAAHGVDPAGAIALRAAVAEALSPPTVPALADAVMESLGHPNELSGPLRHALLDGMPVPPRMADGTVGVLELEDAWPEVRETLLEALRPHRVPPVADGVMQALGAEDESRALIKEALLSEMPDPPRMADDIMAALGRQSEETGEFDDIGELLNEAVRAEAGTAPSLWDGVLSGMSEDEDWSATRDLLNEALRAEAGEVSLADDVMAAIDAEQEDNVIPLHSTPRPADQRPVVVRPRARRFVLPLTGLAAAAALLLVMSAPPVDEPVNDLAAYELSEVNHVEIEDIYTETDAIVQVMSFDEDAPTIIFIDEATDEEGATL